MKLRDPLVFMLVQILAAQLHTFAVHARENPVMVESFLNDTLPYYEIPDAPKEYTAETVVARMIDGLGFRYYWATEGLRDEDLLFRPGKEARSAGETLDHVLDLSTLIINAVRNEVNDLSKAGTTEISFELKRERTLDNLKQASDRLKSGKIKLENCKLVFKARGKVSEYPFWNGINGPIEDAVWHVGQVVSFRRSSGNPYNFRADVFFGKVLKP